MITITTTTVFTNVFRSTTLLPKKERLYVMSRLWQNFVIIYSTIKLAPNSWNMWLASFTGLL